MRSRGGRDFVSFTTPIFLCLYQFCIQTTSSPSSASSHQQLPSFAVNHFRQILILPTSKIKLIHNVHNRPTELPPSSEAARAAGQADIAEVKMQNLTFWFLFLSLLAITGDEIRSIVY